MLLLALSHDPTAGDKRLLSCDRVVSRLCNEHTTQPLRHRFDARATLF